MNFSDENKAPQPKDQRGIMTDDPAQQIHIETQDFKGNRIICTELQWQDHVVGHKRHIEMEAQEDLVIAALCHPVTQMRYHDTNYPMRMTYYGEGNLTRYIKVTVQFQTDECVGTGNLITAYPTNNMKPGEKPEWPIK